MDALKTLLPVFFMLGLGYVSREKNWVTAEQKSGANDIVFGILFPILIFNLLSNAKFDLSTLGIVFYTLFVFLLAILVGKAFSNFTGKDKAHFTPYLIPTVEGGSVALPLYLSIVGTSSLTVIFDLAGAALAFFILPVLVARASASAASGKEMMKSIFSNSFVLATISGLVANIIGLTELLNRLHLLDLYNSVMSAATAPISGIILFVLGYGLYFHKKTILSVARLAMVRAGFYALVILSFFLIFPNFMSDPLVRIGVILYFMCPTGFAMPSIMAPLFKSEKEVQFASTFISLYMFITLVVYAALVIFVA